MSKLEESKASFLTLCQQYARLGALLESTAKATSLKQADHTKRQFFLQFNEMGEQLKILGTAIDAQGGEPVLMPPKKGDTEQMRKVAKAVEDALPDGFGFMVFAFPFDGIMGNPRLSYASNAGREGAINMTKEWLFNQGEKESWMEHTI